MIDKVISWLRRRKAEKFKKKRDKEVQDMLNEEMLKKILGILESLPLWSMKNGDGSCRFTSLDGKYLLSFYSSYRNPSSFYISIHVNDDFGLVDYITIDLRDESFRGNDTKKKIVDYVNRAISLRENQRKMENASDIKRFMKD